MSFLKPLRLFLLLTLITGILYPLFITLIAQMTMQSKAEGSILVIDGKSIGSHLIAQKFESDKYFWGRPSSNNYNPLSSGGSNLSLTNKALKKAVDERKEKILKAHGTEKAPAELLFASASGLDPHISIDTAYFQIDRIAKARNLEKEKIKKLIDERRTYSYVNVLEINLALDQLL
jgi:K+-transporting ATPase ATPase C chain